MNNLKNLLKKPLQVQQIPRYIFISLALLAITGFAIAGYLTIEHYQNTIPPCTVGGCETVLTSDYAKILGVPVSLFGALYYFAILLALFIYFDVKSETVKDICIKFIIASSVLGLLASIYFIVLMLFVIKSICIYCLTSDLICILIFIISCHILYLGYFQKNKIS
jgi:uncharacterized membrane protein